MLINKKILFLCPQFFGYEKEIKKEMELQGAKVVYFDERPKNDFFTKAFIRLNLKKIIAKRIEKHYKQIISSCKEEKYDYLFLVSPETISEKHINEIKNNNPNIKIITYMWDSLRNKRNSVFLVEASDKFFTFEKKDLPSNAKLTFLPLFYIADYESIGKNRSNNFQYDLTFIGTAHSDRYKLIMNILNDAKKANKEVYYYFYSPSKILFYWKLWTDKNFRGVNKKDVSFKSLSKSSIVEIIKKSKAVIDIEHPEQTGLTMRTLEMLGAKRKILTTNKSIANYDFYNATNNFIFNRDLSNLSFNILESDWEDIPENIYKKYSLKSWINTIFRDVL